MWWEVSLSRAAHPLPAGCSVDLSIDQITGYLGAYKLDPDNKEDANTMILKLRVTRLNGRCCKPRSPHMSQE